MNRETWDVTTRVLHWALVIAITFLLGTSLIIATPGTRIFFYLHEYAGLAACVIIIFHWMWSYATADLHLLFPWGGEGWKTVKVELRDLLRGKLPRGGRRASLSSFVHGLGMLAVSATGLTGFFIFLAIPAGRGALAHSQNYAAFTQLSAVHAFFGWFIWAYWFGHVVLALAHLVSKDHVFAGIFTNRGMAQRNARDAQGA